MPFFGPMLGRCIIFAVCQRQTRPMKPWRARRRKRRRKPWGRCQKTPASSEADDEQSAAYTDSVDWAAWSEECSCAEKEDREPDRSKYIKGRRRRRPLAAAGRVGLVLLHEGEYRRWHSDWGSSSGKENDWKRFLQPAVGGLGADHPLLTHHQLQLPWCLTTSIIGNSSGLNS